MSDWYPHVTVATVVERDGLYLMVEESTEQGVVFNQPAGHLDPGETLQQAALRETLEETAWHISLDGLLGIALYTAAGNGVTYQRTTFYGHALHEETGRALDAGILRCCWLSYEDLLERSARMRSPLVIASVEQYRRGQTTPLDFIYYT